MIILFHLILIIRINDKHKCNIGYSFLHLLQIYNRDLIHCLSRVFCHWERIKNTLLLVCNASVYFCQLAQLLLLLFVYIQDRQCDLAFSVHSIGHLSHINILPILLLLLLLFAKYSIDVIIQYRKQIEIWRHATILLEWREYVRNGA
jgi:hypothetical protein